MSLITFSKITHDLSKLLTHDLHMCFKQYSGCDDMLPRSALQDKALIPPASGRVGSQHSQQSLLWTYLGQRGSKVKALH